MDYAHACMAERTEPSRVLDRLLAQVQSSMSNCPCMHGMAMGFQPCDFRSKEPYTNACAGGTVCLLSSFFSYPRTGPNYMYQQYTRTYVFGTLDKCTISPALKKISTVSA